MTTQAIQRSDHTARLAGLLYLILIPVGFFGTVYVSDILVVSGDIATTIQNIVAADSAFRLSMASLFLMNIISIAKALLLYKLLKPLGKTIATFMAAFLLTAAAISMLNEVNYFVVLSLSLADTEAVFTVEQLHYLVALFLDMRDFGSYIAVIFWGLWLFPLGSLLFKADSLLPKIIGAMLIIAGIGYVFDSFVFFIAPHLFISVVDYIYYGEVLFGFWLLIRGANIQPWKWQKAAFAPAS
ncbi:MAG: DUF4386 domain-containing protein [Chloroflexota bacterium]